MNRKVKNYIEQQNMIQKGDHIIAGISGGADSICLLYLLMELKEEYSIKITAVHVNHGIRGQEAKEDADFVEGVCKEKNIPFVLAAEDIPDYSRTYGLTEEEAGRVVRYQAFYRILNEQNGTKIAVAHNKNDQAETILFHLFRGSGLQGLSGIPPVRDVVIRPLFCLERCEIEAYLKAQKIVYRTDMTNFSEEYSRNKIRIQIIPYAKKHINNKIVEHIAQSGELLREITSYIEKQSQSCYDKLVKAENGVYYVDADMLIREDVVIQKSVIREVIKRLSGSLKDITRVHVESVQKLLEQQTGKQSSLPYGILVQKKYGSLIFCYESSQITKKRIPAREVIIPGEVKIPELGLCIQFEIKECVKMKKNEEFPKNRYTKWFDYDKILHAVSLRTRQEGDFITLDRKGSRKKLKSFFIDQKIPKENRDFIPLLADGSHIIWIIGERISQNYKIDKNTKKILCVNVMEETENGT